MRIAFIAHEPHILLLAEIEKFRALVRRSNATGGIAGRIENKQFRSRCDGFGNVRGANGKAVSSARLHVHGSRAGVLHDVRIADPIWRGNDDFVAGLREHADNVKNGMLAADVGDAFFRFVVGTKFALVPRADCFAQRHYPGRGGVLRLVLVDRFNCGLLDVIRSGEVRLTRAEVGDVHALGLELIRGGNDGGGWRDLYAIDAVRELHGFSLENMKIELGVLSYQFSVNSFTNICTAIQETFAFRRSSTMGGTKPVSGAPSCAISRTSFELR